MYSYSTLHIKLREQRGPASNHTCTDCGGQARDWSQVHGTSGQDLEADYVPRCRKCHIAYDGSGHRTPHTEATKQLLSQKNRGYQHTPEAIEKIRAASLRNGISPQARAARLAAQYGQPKTAEVRSKISRKLQGNTNATGKRSPEALENIRRGQRERRRREREGGDADGT
jgi:hypothetical protein